MFNWLEKKKFNKIVQENLNELVRFAYARCHDRCLAEDLVQETCLKAYKAYISKTEDIVKPKEWLYRILINTHISYLRKKQIQIANDFDLNNCELVTFNTVNEDEGLELQKEIIEEDLNLALSKLTLEHREVIYLVDIKGYSFKEASELIGIPFGTLTSRLHRGRLKLKTILVQLGYSSDSIKAGNNGL